MRKMFSSLTATLCILALSKSSFAGDSQSQASSPNSAASGASHIQRCISPSARPILMEEVKTNQGKPIGAVFLNCSNRPAPAHDDISNESITFYTAIILTKKILAEQIDKPLFLFAITVREKIPLRIISIPPNQTRIISPLTISYGLAQFVSGETLPAATSYGCISIPYMVREEKKSDQLLQMGFMLSCASEKAYQDFLKNGPQEQNPVERPGVNSLITKALVNNQRPQVLNSGRSHTL